MSGVFKIFVVFLLASICAEGKIKRSEKVLPIEVVLNPESDGKAGLAESSIVKNKAIELQIRSKENEGGKVDLIIEATKEVRATEQNIDRYSPAFNAESSFLNNETPQDLTSAAKSNNYWDTARQDSPLLYPSQSADLIPYLMLRQVLQTPQPFILGRNQFSPLQNLRHFEDNLQKQLRPHANQGLGPVNNVREGVVVSQPIFTGGVSQNILGQQRLLNSPQALNLLQQGLLQLNNQNIPLHPEQLSQVQSPPLNRYSIINGSPLKLQSPHNQNFLQNNALSSDFQEPVKPYPEHQRIQPSIRQQPYVPQSIPDILGPNRQPLPIQNRPEYTLERNLRNHNPPVHRNTHLQTILPQQRDIPQDLPKLLNSGISNYHQNRDILQALPYQPVIKENPHQHLYIDSQQPKIPQHHRSLPPIQSAVRISVPNDLHHIRNEQNPDHVPLHTYRERYRPPLREYNADSLNQQSYHGLNPPQQSLPNDYQNPVFRNDPLTNIPEDERKIPYRHHSSEDSIQSLPQSSYPPRHSINSEEQSVQSHPPPYSNRQIYKEPTYRSQPRNTAHGYADTSSQSDEVPQPDPERSNKYKESYESSVPTKKRKLRSRKKTQSKDKGDLEGHSSHQYIIKIG